MKQKIKVEIIMEGDDAVRLMEDVESELSFPDEFWDKIKDISYSVETIKEEFVKSKDEVKEK